MGDSKQIWLPLSRSPCLTLLASSGSFLSSNNFTNAKLTAERGCPRLVLCGGEDLNTKPLDPSGGSSDTHQRHLDPIGMYVTAGNQTDYSKSDLNPMTRVWGQKWEELYRPP